MPKRTAEVVVALMTLALVALAYFASRRASTPVPLGTSSAGGVNSQPDTRPHHLDVDAYVALLKTLDVPDATLNGVRERIRGSTIQPERYLIRSEICPAWWIGRAFPDAYELAVVFVSNGPEPDLGGWTLETVDKTVAITPVETLAIYELDRGYKAYTFKFLLDGSLNALPVTKYPDVDSTVPPSATSRASTFREEQAIYVRKGTSMVKVAVFNGSK